MEPKEPSPTHPNRTESTLLKKSCPSSVIRHPSVRPSVIKLILWNPYFLGEKFFVLKTWHLSFLKKKSETFCSKKVAARFFFSLTLAGQLVCSKKKLRNISFIFIYTVVPEKVDKRVIERSKSKSKSKIINILTCESDPTSWMCSFFHKLIPVE